jgi:alpha/beta superfamily hydrolase
VLVDKLHTQKGITITQNTIPGANHFFTGQSEELIDHCQLYLDKRMGLIEGGIEETKLLR